MCFCVCEIDLIFTETPSTSPALVWFEKEDPYHMVTVFIKSSHWTSIWLNSMHFTNIIKITLQEYPHHMVTFFITLNAFNLIFDQFNILSQYIKIFFKSQQWLIIKSPNIDLIMEYSDFPPNISYDIWIIYCFDLRSSFSQLEPEVLNLMWDPYNLTMKSVRTILILIFIKMFQ